MPDVRFPLRLRIALAKKLIEQIEHLVVRAGALHVGADAAGAIQQQRIQSRRPAGEDTPRIRWRPGGSDGILRAPESRIPERPDLARCPRVAALASGFDGLPQLGGTNLDIGAAGLRAGDREHERRSVTEVSLILDRPGAVGQTAEWPPAFRPHHPARC